MRKFKYRRPKFAGRAAFKTLLKRNGFLVPRNFFGRGCCIAEKNNRLYRFLFLYGEVDVSCKRYEFDRWANSTDDTIDIEQFKVMLKKINTQEATC